MRKTNSMDNLFLNLKSPYFNWKQNNKPKIPLQKGKP